MSKLKSEIKKIKAREILDSRGNPTVEVELSTDIGVFYSSVPSGASKGKYEACELRDGGKRFFGMGVKKAVKNINEIIGPKLKGRDVTKQNEIDDFLGKLDGTENKSKLGANAILPVSMAVCRAGATAKNLPLFSYIRQLAENTSSLILPRPCFNIINGGAHAGNDLDIQEFMVIPEGKSFRESLQRASEIYHRLKKILKEKFGSSAINVGDEGGFAPPIQISEQALDFILKAAENLGYLKNLKVILDVAASQLFVDPVRNIEQNQKAKKKRHKISNGVEGKYKMEFGVFTSEGLLKYYSDLVQKYPILAIEDPFAEEDWKGFQSITEKFGKKITIIGDDLTVTNPERIKLAKEKNACNGVIIKPNQIGTVIETIEAVKLARSYGWKVMVSHRSGETNDDFIADLAVGIGADFIKAGAPARGERVAKYNRLLKIEEENL